MTEAAPSTAPAWPSLPPMSMTEEIRQRREVPAGRHGAAPRDGAVHVGGDGARCGHRGAGGRQREQEAHSHGQLGTRSRRRTATAGQSWRCLPAAGHSQSQGQREAHADAVTMLLAARGAAWVLGTVLNSCQDPSCCNLACRRPGTAVVI
jgi:hypothetical protein